MTTEVEVHEVGADAAEAVTAVIHAGFGARERLDPRSTAMDETVASVAEVLEAGGGLLASSGGRPAGALLFADHSGRLALRRVSVVPDAQGSGVARALVSVAETVAERRGYRSVELGARSELPATIAFWRHLGYDELARTGKALTMAKELPLRTRVAGPDDMRALGERLASVLRAGDLVVLHGGLGAGKTTFTQGVGAGLNVRGDMTSPTFVIARVHPARDGGTALVHVDAYRLAGAAEIDDLDLDASMEESVTVVEWGGGLAEGLAESRLDVSIVRDGEATLDPGEDEPRTVDVVPVGARWIGAGLADAVRSGP